MKRTTKSLAILLALLMCLSLVACGGQPAGNDPAGPDAGGEGEAKTFTVGFDAEFPPFGFIDANGEYDGFDLAIAEEVCSRLGWTFVAQPIAWESKDAELAAGNIDCIWNGFTKSEARLDEYTWSDAYYDNSIVMVVRADSGLETLADLAGKAVITQAGSSALTALEENPELTDTFSQFLETADYNSAFMELQSGAVDAIAADVGVAKYNMDAQEGSFVIMEEPIASEIYAIGFLKGNDELAATVWEQVLAIAEDGTMATIAQNYVDYGLVLESLTLVG